MNPDKISTFDSHEKISSEVLISYKDIDGLRPELLIPKEEIIFNIQGVSYAHPNQELLFSDLNFTLARREKLAIVGNNGSGKTTLLKLISGELIPTHGNIFIDGSVCHVRQIISDQRATVADAMGVSDKVMALRAILEGGASEFNLSVLNDDWDIEERCLSALKLWGLPAIDLFSRMTELSGGQRTRVMLAGIEVQKPDLVLLDEPSNHLDNAGRAILYEYIQTAAPAVIVVSHDRALLNLMGKIVEVGAGTLRVYGGNYDFYLEQKSIEEDAFVEKLRNAENSLRNAREKERESAERQQKLDARGKRKQEKSGLPTISMNTFRNNAENSTARLKGAHEEKIQGLDSELKSMRDKLSDPDEMKVDFGSSLLHKGKLLVRMVDVNFNYHQRLLWNINQDFEIRGGDRIAIAGLNGSGKTTLIKLILGLEQPTTGKIERGFSSWLYIDQDYSLLDDELTVYEQALQFNPGTLQEHEVKGKLSKFLFSPVSWSRRCRDLSGGEKLRLILCSLTLKKESPDILVLDEPTNNLDLQNVEILTKAVNDYKGTLIVISHDELFKQQVGFNRELVLNGAEKTEQ